MAVEAQLCPQCGATVQFGELQTEVVCSYCGATVDKTLLQSIQRVNDVSELPFEGQEKLNRLILDGRRKDAVYSG
jgi:DNA-directed RNA polymerase subunit RPC12/RpoP